jgi:hypothetical protein
MAVKIKRTPSMLALVLLLAAPVAAAGQATEEEAKTMALKAADYLKSVGPDKALADFSARDGPWHDRDLYVTVQNNRGVMVANGTNPGLIGRDVLELKDPEGKSFNHDIQAIRETGWVDFKWQNPVTREIEPKTTFEVRVGNYIIGVGAYARTGSDH